MKIPGYQAAIIPERKITDYLLSPIHPVGRFKAQFLGKFGFTHVNPDVLMASLAKHAYNEYANAEETQFGVRYIIEAPIFTPDGRNPVIRSIWFMEKLATAPVFVTAYPVKGKKEW